jgi:hypothetical protein
MATLTNAFIQLLLMPWLQERRETVFAQLIERIHIYVERTPNGLSRAQ